jgi:hypothetical protein
MVGHQRFRVLSYRVVVGKRSNFPPSCTSTLKMEAAQSSEMLLVSDHNTITQKTKNIIFTAVKTSGVAL